MTNVSPTNIICVKMKPLSTKIFAKCPTIDGGAAMAGIGRFTWDLARSS
jgi:hypothetical protein